MSLACARRMVYITISSINAHFETSCVLKYLQWSSRQPGLSASSGLLCLAQSRNLHKEGFSKGGVLCKFQKRLRLVWNITRQTRKKNTVNGYHFVLGRFTKEFGRRRIDSITSEDAFCFLAALTKIRKQSTRYSRCAHLRAFFNHILDRYQLKFPNPCDSSVIKRVFRPPRIGIRTVIGRESVTVEKS